MLLIIMLLAVTVGFALLSTTLKINGLTGIKSNTWDIHWDGTTAQVTEGSVTTTKPTVDGTNNDTVSFSVQLELPGDFYEFTIDAVNAGTIDGAVSVLPTIEVYDENNIKLSGDDIPDYINYEIKYADGSSITSGDVLKSTKSKKYRVRIEIDSNAENLPSVNKTYTYKSDMSYEQHKSVTPTTYQVYSPGDTVKYDPVSNQKCTSGDTCYTWRVITVGDTDSKDKITLQLNHNIVDDVKWGGDYYEVYNEVYPDNPEYIIDNYSTITNGPFYILINLENSTKNWNDALKLNYRYNYEPAEDEESMSYSDIICVNGVCKDEDDNVLVSNVKARIITGEEVKALVMNAGAASNSFAGNWKHNANSWDVEFYYFSNKNYIIGTEDNARNGVVGDTSLSWLIENTGTLYSENSGSTANAYGDDNPGYWTLSVMHGAAPWSAWYVGSDGTFSFDAVYYDFWGIRPVIDLPKSVIK